MEKEESDTVPLVEESATLVGKLGKSEIDFTFVRKKEVLVTHVQSVESMSVVHRKDTLYDYLHLTDYKSPIPLSLNLEEQSNYKNKAPP